MKYIDLSIQDRQDILRRVQSETGKDLQIIEKYWWVTALLRALFALPYAQHPYSLILVHMNNQLLWSTRTPRGLIYISR